MKLLVVLLISIFFISCTRSLDDKSDLKISIPSSSKLSAQQTTMYPMFAAVSIHYPDSPTLSRNFELKDKMSNSTGEVATGDLEILVPKVKQGQKNLIQLLVVYEDMNSGALEFNYGDVVADITGGENVLNILISAIGTSTKEITFAGRYLTTTTSGPTGVVSMMLHPPNGKPAMEVEKESIHNGWFNFFHPGGNAEISYVIKAQNKVLFEKITESSSVFTAANHKLKVSVPSHFSKDRNTYFNNRIASDLYLGFYQDPSTSISLTGHKVCYVDRTHAVPGAYTAVSPSYTPLLYKPTGGTAGTDVTVSGGSGYSFDIVYNSATCNVLSETNLIFHSEHTGHGFDDGAFGSRGVFSMINPMQKHDSAFVTAKDVGGTSVVLDWKYLPGVLGTSITGTTVFAKYDTYGGGNHFDGDDYDCREQAELDGMVAVNDTSSEQYTFTGGGGLPALSNTGVYPHDFKFMLCPYKDTSIGRLYSRDGISVHCIGGCNDPFNFGLGHQDETVSGTTSVNAITNSYGAQVTGYTINSSDISLTTANVWGTTAFVAGDEVVLNVVAAGADGQCNVSGPSVEPGFFLFTRVLGIGPLRIPRDPVIESINTTELAETTRTPTSSFCLLTVTKVIELRDLSISSELNTVPANLTTPSVQNIFIKVSGTLTFSGTPSINVSGKGFSGGASTSEHGAGIKGVENAANSTGTGGEYGSGFSGGGAGYGAGGENSSFNRAQGLHNDHAMYMGGGGAEYGAQAGQNGGGLIYITARHVDIQANTTISADGLSTSGSEGAGAGGSIWMVFDEVTNASANTLTVSANGGYAGTSGAGGGGLIKGRMCNADIGNITFSNDGGGTTGSAQQEGEAGNFFDPMGSQDNWICEN